MKRLAPLLCSLPFLCFLLMSCEIESNKLFTSLPSNQTNIHFNNFIDESEEINVNTYMNIYTGGGVAAGDLNNDGLADLFFSGNQVSSRLYLNKGNLKFEDITETSGIMNTGWATGVAMADVNQDGWLDIYVCVSGSAINKKNLLFINKHDNTFKESAEGFGIADKRQSMHASFFDYDRDGDLDLFIITNPASYENKVNHLQPRKLNGESESTDVLYRNNGNNTYTDVSHDAGIIAEGYSLGLAVTDINNDSWPDIYISNDFVGNDILYINNQNGTFTNQAATYFKHTSFAGMGNEIADINNDGLVDVLELDMRPESNERLKLIIPPTGFDKYNLSIKMGYEPQFTRNTLQLNRGNNYFSEISFLAGISSTDWSWSPLLADFDNDGDKDLFVTNGFLRDLGNMDFITYQNIYNTPLGTVQAKTDKKLSAIKSLESAPLKNYFFENSGSLSFIDRTIDWGIKKEGFSHGATYADLDNDGDLDLVINNMNAEAEIFRNNTNQIYSRNYLRIKFIGTEKNRDGIGARVMVHNKLNKQLYEHFLNRGFESSVDGVMHIGLDSVHEVDSIIVVWPDEKFQVLRKVKANQQIEFNYKNSLSRNNIISRAKPLFTLSENIGLNYIHAENEFIDFKIQPLLPQMHSRNGPGIAVSDVNRDGLEDFFIGGSMQQSGVLFIQGLNGKFKKKFFFKPDSLADIMGVLFFDADNDNDDDLYLVTGGSENHKESSAYLDHLYLNNGKGDFSEAKNVLPEILQSGSCVIASDFDHDGDLDLFLGGRIIPGEYPLTPNSYLFRNDSKGNIVRFTDITQSICPQFLKLGLVTSVLWTDVDNDGWADLMVAGEFMPIAFFKNKKGKSFEKIGSISLEHTSGWWNSLSAGDYDNDGDTDYIAGNLGLNSRYKGNAKEPICMDAKDYDKNGSIDPVMSHYLQGEKYIIHSRDELINQIPAMKLRFINYKNYAEATFENSFLKSELGNAYHVCAEWFNSSYLENKGNGNFAVKPLPIEAQLSPIFGIVTEDFDGDGNLDVLTSGNMYSMEVTTGRSDASFGLYLKYDGIGNFKPIDAATSGFYADGDAKGMVKLSGGGNNSLVLVGNNSNGLMAYTTKQGKQSIKPEKTDAYALLTKKNGKVSKREFYFGSGYISHTSRLLYISDDVISVQIFSVNGQSRKINLKTQPN